MVYTDILSCGMRVAFRKVDSSVAYAALTIQSGTRNEPDGLNGMAHFTEHMLFKGTQQRTSSQISNRLESLGGELNAYTTKEETVLYSTVLLEDMPKAVDLLMELAFTSTFPEKELRKERQVVIDEINMYKDSPSESIYDDFETLLFEGHPLSRNILGSARSLGKFTSEDVRSYTSSNFKPERMCLSIVAGINPEKALKTVIKSLERYVGSDYRAVPSELPSSTPGSLTISKVFSKDVVKKNHQVNCIIGTSGYSLYEDERVAVVLLSNILGGPCSNSRLNQLLRERNALVYSIDCSYVQFQDTGSVLIGFGCEKQNLERCIELVHRELSLMRERPVSPTALKSAKKQLLGQLAISSDNGESQVLSMGKSMVAYNAIVPEEETRRHIGEVTSERLQSAARAIFDPSRLSTMTYR